MTENFSVPLLYGLCNVTACTHPEIDEEEPSIPFPVHFF